MKRYKHFGLWQPVGPPLASGLMLWRCNHCKGIVKVITRPRLCPSCNCGVTVEAAR